MFQAKINNIVTPSNWNSSISNRIDISDKIVQTPTFFEYEFLGDIYYFLSFPYFLFKLESQFTKKTKIFSKGNTLPSVSNTANVNSYERFVTLTWYYNTNPLAIEDLTDGKVIVGDDDFPLGFYNITVYEMETNDDLNPDNAKAVLYNGIVNMYPSTDDNSNNFEEVQYNDYTINDADNDSVYITY